MTEQAKRVTEQVLAAVAAQLGVPVGAVDPNRTLRDQGLDSLGSVAVAAAVAAQLGRPVSPVALWSYPTVAAFVAHLEAGEATETVAAPEQRAEEPIAIVGIGCRTPGADGPAALWDLLMRGVDATGEVPRRRWNPDRVDAPRRGGFLRDVAGFDAAFFGISPREAEQMDPQQRLALELAWETLEDAGIPPHSLRESRTGVFMGVFFNDYDTLRVRARAIDAHSTTGTCFSFVANRISYALGLRGPSLALDSACSASLAAIHLACQSLRAGETALALAGGVHLLLAPETMEAVARFGALSPDGRCCTFDARANGYARGEGGAILALKRLSQAQRDGDRVYAVVRGSAVNNDGPSNGLTAPSAVAQAAVIRDAIGRAGVAPASVGYVELHGTGTPLGDPIEAEALGAAYAAGRTAPLRVGSIKTNIGHLEAAAGALGVVKAALAIHHGAIPASLNYEMGNPHIDLDRLRLRVVREAEHWTEDAPRRAGVSSFGLGGTNAHAILEGVEGPSQVLRLGEELAEVRAALAALPPSLGLADACAAVEPSASPGARVAVWGRTRSELLAALDNPGAAARVVGRPAHDRLVFVFSGMGSQWHGMGRRLYAAEPVFRRTLEACDAALAALRPGSLIDDIFDDSAGARLRDPDAHDVYNPVIIAIQIAHAALFRSWGIQPSAIVGHCIGEVAAAQAAGALTIPDAMAVIHAIGRAYRETVETGRAGAAFVAAPPEQILAHAASLEGAYELACHNDGASGVISGEADAVRAAVAHFSARGAFTRWLSDVYTHCRGVEPFLPALVERTREIRPRPCEVPMISTLRAAPVEGRELTGAYWAANTRHRVRFAEGVAALADQGFSCFLELGAHALFARSIRSIFQARPCEVIAGQVRDEDGHQRAREALARLHVAGVERRPAPLTPELLVLSARSEAALDQHCSAFAERLRRPGADLHEVCGAAAAREPLPIRRAIVAASPAEAARALAAPSALASAVAPAGTAGAVFVFGGHGAHWPGMARALRQEPVFRDALERCRAAMASDGYDLLDALDSEEIIDVQRVLFATQVGLVALLADRGVRPAAVVGHSLGEVAAAVAAGALSVEAGARVIVTRSRLIRAQAGAMDGGMLAVPLGEEAVRPWLDGTALVVGAVNADDAVVISGRRAALGDLATRLAQAGISTRAVRIGFAAHAPAMDPVEGAMAEALADLEPRATELPLVSTVTGRRATGDALTGAYWARNVRAPVRFDRAVRQLIADGHRCFLEVGGHPALGPALRAGLRAAGVDGAVIGTLRSGDGGLGMVLEGLAKLWVAGGAEARGLYRGATRTADLPTYPWQRRRFWLEGLEEAKDWFYRVAWHELAPGSSRAPRRWIVVADQAGAATRLAGPLGEAAVVRDRGELERALRAAGPEAVGVVHLGALDATHPLEAAAACQGALDTLGATLAAGRDARIFLVTRGAQALEPEPGESGVAQAAVWGIGRVLALEHPERWGGLIDLDPAGDLDVVALAAALRGADGETQLLLRGGRRYVARLVRHAPIAATGRRRDGVHVVTGGLGGIGRAVARWLVSQGARRLVLAGRRGATEGDASFLAELRRTAEVEVVAADLADAGDVARLLETARALGPLSSIHHAAGVVERRALGALEPGELEAVLGAKVAGTWALHTLTRTDPVAEFVLYSSIAAVWGAREHGAYAAANHVMDRIALHRRALGLPARSVNWGAWEAGMATPEVRAELARSGVRAMPADEALEALGRLGDEAQALIADVDWRRFRAIYEAQAPAPLFAALEAEPPAQAAPAAPAARARFSERLVGLTPAQREASLLPWLQEQIATVLRLDPAATAPDRSLSELGLDSILAVELSERLTAAGLALPLARLVSGARIDALARELAGQLSPGTEAEPAAQAQAAPSRGWVVIPRPAPDAAFRLICAPYAGGGPAVYRPWLDALPPWIELVILQPPGRDGRLDEPPFTRMEDLADATADALAPLLDRPYALFGHCLGALILYETAARLRDRGLPLPVHFFASGARSPQYYNPEQFALDVVQYSPLPDVPGHQLPESEFLDFLRDLDFGTSDALFQSAEARRLFLPAVRADLEVNNRYCAGPVTPLPLPVTAVGGRVDPYVSAHHVEGWRAVTSQGFHSRYVAGNHYFIATQRDALIGLVAQTLGPALAQVPMPPG